MGHAGAAGVSRGAGPPAYPAAMSRYCFTIAFAFFSRRLIRECIQPSV